MVAAESTFDIPDHEEMELVTQKKYNLDPERPWWQKAWLRYIFLPFVRFSFRRMGIALPQALLPDGTIVFYEIQAIFSDRADAEDICKENGEFWQHRPIAVNAPLPKESFQYSRRRRYPKSIMADRYNRRPYPFAVAPLHQLAVIQRNIDRASRALADT